MYDACYCKWTIKFDVQNGKIRNWIFSFYILKVVTLKPGKKWISVLLCFEYGMNNSSLTHRLLTFLRFLTVHQLHWNVQSHKQIWKTFCTELQNIIFFSANLCFKLHNNSCRLPNNFVKCVLCLTANLINILKSVQCILFQWKGKSLMTKYTNTVDNSSYPVANTCNSRKN